MHVVNSLEQLTTSRGIVPTVAEGSVDLVERAAVQGLGSGFGDLSDGSWS